MARITLFHEFYSIGDVHYYVDTKSILYKQERRYQQTFLPEPLFQSIFECTKLTQKAKISLDLCYENCNLHVLYLNFRACAWKQKQTMKPLTLHADACHRTKKADRS